MSDYFDATLASISVRNQTLDRAVAAKAISNFVMTEVMRVLKDTNTSIDAFAIQPARMAGLIDLRTQEKISSSGAQTLFELMLTHPEDPEALAEAHKLLQVSDTNALLPVVTKVLDDNPKQLNAYLNGKEGLIGYFIGQVMRSFEGSPDPKIVRQMLIEQIDRLKTEAQ